MDFSCAPIVRVLSSTASFRASIQRAVFSYDFRMTSDRLSDVPNADHRRARPSGPERVLHALRHR